MDRRTSKFSVELSKSLMESVVRMRAMLASKRPRKFLQR